MSNTLGTTNFKFPSQLNHYKGKVREVYTLENDLVVMIASDRISAFDYILPKGIPYKGQVLNQIAELMLNATSDIVPNWKMATPDPSVTVGKTCKVFPIEMVIRGYLAGHAWREYKAGRRMLCGVTMPEGMQENDEFPEPIITPATKAEEGHDEDIAREEIIKQGIISESDYLMLEDYTRKLFQRGTELVEDRGLILVDTKYEFGRAENGEILLIDEIHTPDSSRFFYADGYAERQSNGEKQKQLSKEFVREWLMENDFQGLEGQTMPNMTDAFVELVSERYIELFENITGKAFVKGDISTIESRVEANVLDWLQK